MLHRRLTEKKIREINPRNRNPADVNSFKGASGGMTSEPITATALFFIIFTSNRALRTRPYDYIHNSSTDISHDHDHVLEKSSEEWAPRRWASERATKGDGLVFVESFDDLVWRFSLLIKVAHVTNAYKNNFNNSCRLLLVLLTLSRGAWTVCSSIFTIIALARYRYIFLCPLLYSSPLTKIIIFLSRFPQREFGTRATHSAHSENRPSPLCATR